MIKPKAFKNKKGHLVIKISMVDVVEMFGGVGICDHCNKADFEGYLIPVLGEKWFCKKCYKDWEERAVYYKEDREYEKKVFTKLLNITGAEDNTEKNNTKNQEQ